MCNISKEKIAFGQIEKNAESLISAGLGLKALGDLLGADLEDHALDEGQKNNLAHAVFALGQLVISKSSDIYTDATEAMEVE